MFVLTEKLNETVFLELEVRENSDATLRLPTSDEKRLVKKEARTTHEKLMNSTEKGCVVR